MMRKAREELASDRSRVQEGEEEIQNMCYP
jgi:hypothetical protein